MSVTELYETALRLRDTEREVRAANQRRWDYEAKFGRSYTSWSPHGPSDTLNGRHEGGLRMVRELLEALDEFNEGWTFCVTGAGDAYCSRGMVHNDTGEVRTVALDGPDAGKLVSVPDAKAVPSRG